MARCLVLGANGFIGSHLVDSLTEKGHFVRAFDRFGHSKTFSSEGVELFEGDFLNRDDLAKAISGMDYVFHLISTTTPASAEDDPLIDISTNVHMSVVLFQLCVSSKVKRVIFVSTGGAIYGDVGTSLHREIDRPEPVSPYAIGKLTIEHYLRYFRIKHNLDSVILRLSNPFGERQPFSRKQGVIPIFLERLCKGESLRVFGDGTMIRDYVYIGDVAEAIVRVFDKNTKYKTYNIGSGIGVSIGEIVNHIEKATGKVCKVDYQPAPSTYVHEVVLNTSRFTKEFGTINNTPFSEGIKKTYQYIKGELNKEEKHEAK